MGRSVASNPPKDEAGLAQWQVLDGLDLKKPIVGGLSDGGYSTAFNPSDKNIGKFKKSCTVHPERRFHLFARKGRGAREIIEFMRLPM
jgi:hypothetical protein